MIDKLCLGTAKVGMPNYGYSSSDISIDGKDFLLQSLSLGISSIDTSPRYGNAEKIIGTILRTRDKRLNISTKIDNLVPYSIQNLDLMLHSIEHSLKSLNTDIIDICYLHQNDMKIISDKNVHKGIEILKKKGLIKEIGTSVYSKTELQYSLNSQLFDWVQIPINILDTSFYNMICEISTNIKVSARSVFLQGILLNRKFISTDIKNYKELLNTLNLVDRLCAENNINFQQLSIAYLSQLDRINKIIVGTTSIGNLEDNILSSSIKLSNELINLIGKISNCSKTWTNPRHWRNN
jgi:aryl-alcohol dehydrogenase-like predicted oxidoreductase